MKTTEETPLISKIGQAYQVIGQARFRAEPISDEEWNRALDYFADEAAYDPDFLPWPAHHKGAEAHD